VLIRNHEISPGDNKIGAFGEENERLGQLNTALLYDAGFGKTPGLGGTSTVHFDTRTGEVKRQFMSLAGTARNCAGGPTPWNSWITCEETVLTVGDLCEKDHGFCFEVPASAGGLVAPVPLTAMGRFNHEAIAVDPKSGCVYLTEDRHDGLLYRFIPNVPGQMAEGGRLQALAFKERPSADSRNWNQDIQVKMGETIAVQWIDIADPLSPNDDMRQVGFTAGAARFARGEGMWHGNDSVYFACTNGGPIQKGQIWRYHPSAAEGTDAEHVRPGYLQQRRQHHREPLGRSGGLRRRLGRAVPRGRHARGQDLQVRAQRHRAKFRTGGRNVLSRRHHTLREHPAGRYYPGHHRPVGTPDGLTDHPLKR
jgi:hypothetical protein